MKKTVLFLLLLSIVTFFSCSKQSNTTTLKVNLTDAPLDAEEVNIDLQAVRVKFSDDSSGWQTSLLYQAFIICWPAKWP